MFKKEETLKINSKDQEKYRPFRLLSGIISSQESQTEEEYINE